MPRAVIIRADRGAPKRFDSTMMHRLGVCVLELVWRPANNFLKAVESESQFFRAKAANKPSKIVKLFAGRDTSSFLSGQARSVPVRTTRLS